MNSGEKGFCVRILEREFKVGCLASQEPGLIEAAQYLDQQMRKIQQAGKVIGLERIAMMAALNIAYELLMVKKAAPDPGNALERLQVLLEKIDGALTQPISGIKSIAYLKTPSMPQGSKQEKQTKIEELA